MGQVEFLCPLCGRRLRGLQATPTNRAAKLLKSSHPRSRASRAASIGISKFHIRPAPGPGDSQALIMEESGCHSSPEGRGMTLGLS